MNVKLIVCDVDGTLLKKGETRLENRVKEEIVSLLGKGIRFYVASGRTYSELLSIFEGLTDKIGFICLDGSQIFENGVFVNGFPIEKESVKKIVSIAGKNLVLYGKRNNYNENYENVFEDIYKISVCNKEIIEKLDLYVNNNRLCRKIYEDNFWNDYISNDADKQKAVEFIKEKYNIKYVETAVFGDNVNDFGLMRTGLFSFAMKNSVPELKKIAKFETDNISQELRKMCGGVNYAGL